MIISRQRLPAPWLSKLHWHAKQWFESGTLFPGSVYRSISTDTDQCRREVDILEMGARVAYLMEMWGPPYLNEFQGHGQNRNCTSLLTRSSNGRREVCWCQKMYSVQEQVVRAFSR